VLDDDDGELTKVLLSVSVSHVDGLDVLNGLSVRVQFWRCGWGVEDIVSLHPLPTSNIDHPWSIFQLIN
jgi:hypothetical protein